MEKPPSPRPRRKVAYNPQPADESVVAQPAPWGDYEVGYGKPPKETQFTNGTSGNPAGRPKGSKNFGTLVKQALDKKVPVTDAYGRKKMIAKREVGATRFANRVMDGEPKTIEAAIRIEGHGGSTKSIDRPPLAAFGADDRELFEGLMTEIADRVAAETRS